MPPPSRRGCWWFGCGVLTKRRRSSLTSSPCGSAWTVSTQRRTGPPRSSTPHGCSTGSRRLHLGDASKPVLEAGDGSRFGGFTVRTTQGANMGSRVLPGYPFSPELLWHNMPNAKGRQPALQTSLTSGSGAQEPRTQANINKAAPIWVCLTFRGPQQIGFPLVSLCFPFQTPKAGYPQERHPCTVGLSLANLHLAKF